VAEVQKKKVDKKAKPGLKKVHAVAARGLFFSKLTKKYENFGQAQIPIPLQAKIIKKNIFLEAFSELSPKILATSPGDIPLKIYWAAKVRKKGFLYRRFVSKVKLTKIIFEKLLTS